MYGTRLTICEDTKTAHFLKQDYKVFDAPFFSITPKEAEAMDPTHRMLLEVTYEGFENGRSRASPVSSFLLKLESRA